MSNIVIGIEGYVGAGKSAICRELLNHIPNSIILEGGNLYRAIVYSLLKSGIDLSNLKQNMSHVDIKSIMEKLKITIAIENRQTAIYIDGQKIDEEKLQSSQSSLAVSEIGTIANNDKLYEFGRKLIDQFKEKYNVIVSGRALMEIYPNLDYHFMITASLDERIRRKSIQYNNKIDLEELKELSVVGGDDNGGNVSPYSIKTSLITLTVITISITSTFSVGEACSWPW